MIEHRESEPSEFIAKKDLDQMAEPEWPGETIRKRENDEKDKKPVINDNFWRNSDNTES